MRFHIGAIPEDFEPDESWRSIYEPSPAWLQIFAVPIAIAMTVLFAYLWQNLTEFSSLTVHHGYQTLFAVATALSLPALILVHELLHAVAHPMFGLSSATLIGAWPSRLLFYAHYSGPLTRNRFLLVFAMPLLVISCVPLALAAAGLLPSSLQLIAAWFSIWNALFACGDVLGFFLLLLQVPSNALVQNKGWRSYWKPSVS